ncbi:MAG TPA: uroporphyrinogen decarboxylase [Candidatus Sulfotelmatobacter sp.]|jgi:uroporphyrinogen decarboxylase|nr:uroporphyrinogen decarboxylase [Candidatus Sulfotelmatobacter sp.]
MNTIFLDACFNKNTTQTPVWFMRQAGRYLPEYRKLKGEKNILDIVKTPELAAQISLQPVDILNVDAAILYADIMIPLLGIDIDLAIVENIGPVIKEPLQTLQDVEKLRILEPESDIPYVLQTISILKKELEKKVPLIGFSAAPFTLASYLIEGKPTRDFIKTKSFMYTNRKAWDLLMEKLSDLIIVYLQSQIVSGVQVLQLFDSWVGCLSPQDYQRYVLPHSKRIFAVLQNTSVPLIHFGTNIAGMLTSFASVNCNVIGIDWRMSIAEAWENIGYEKAIQGNLDPVMLLGDFSLIKKYVDEMFDSLPKREGYILNLGHGVLPATPVGNLMKLVEYVHKK